jgi:hypothetical protein
VVRTATTRIVFRAALESPKSPSRGVILSKEELTKSAAEIFRLLRPFRAIQDRAVRLHVVETVEAMAESRSIPDGSAYTKRSG